MGIHWNCVWGCVRSVATPRDLICNMQSNVLNDLVEAMKALDGKKVCDPSLQCDCFVLLMRWRHIPKGVSRPAHMCGWSICAMTGCACLFWMICIISNMKASGSSTSAWASESGLSSTMAMSISPPSFLMRGVLPSCILFKITTALFSHTFRSHSSTALCVKTRERRGSSFSQLGLEPNHTGLTAQSLFFLEESCRVKRSDTQTFSNFSNYFKRVLKLQKRSSSFSK